MGVTYKLRDEVVEYIISQKQADPSSSCRQLAESASEKFGLKLSKSSIHDVLKEKGIVTPRGRKPKSKFEIPQAKKKQIQVSLSQVKLNPTLENNPPIPTQPEQIKVEPPVEVFDQQPAVIMQQPADIVQHPEPSIEPLMIEQLNQSEVNQSLEEVEISEVYEGAGKIFYKATQWDLGIFTEGNIKEKDWDYYLTYTKGVKIVLENNQNIFIDLPLPIERCVREVADGLINNVRPFLVQQVSNQELFQALMSGGAGYKIDRISIVGQDDHIISEFSNIVDNGRSYIVRNRHVVESKKRNFLERLKLIFFSQDINLDVINLMLNVRGIDKTSKEENIVKLLVEDTYEYKNLLQQAASKLNDMYLWDDQDRLVKVEI